MREMREVAKLASPLRRAARARRRPDASSKRLRPLERQNSPMIAAQAAAESPIELEIVAAQGNPST